MQNFSFENEFDLHENKRVGAKNIFLYEWSFARRLVLKQRQRATRKWSIIPGGLGHMKAVRKLGVLLRGINFGFWSYLGCSGENAIICIPYVSVKVSFSVSHEEILYVWFLQFKEAQNSNISVRSLGSNGPFSAGNHAITRGFVRYRARLKFANLTTKMAARGFIRKTMFLPN